MRSVLLALALVASGVTFHGDGAAQRWSAPRNRRACMAQCDRALEVCQHVLRRPAEECTTFDNQCRLDCNTRYPEGA